MPREHSPRIGARSLFNRAREQAGDGASLLFSHLGVAQARPEEAALLLERVAARVRAGAWNDAVADLVERAEALDRSLTEE
jgi:hypothetical protein